MLLVWKSPCLSIIPERIDAKDWTNGCIALQNKDMDILFAHVIDGTPIEIRK